MAERTASIALVIQQDSVGRWTVMGACAGRPVRVTLV